MTVRKPLAKGDDGSANRYPVRTQIGFSYDGSPVYVVEEADASYDTITHTCGDSARCECGAYSSHRCQSGYLAFGRQEACSKCVPAALIVETPERFDPPCEGDES